MRSLTREQVIAARAAYEAGDTIEDITKRLGANHSSVHKMLCGQTYRDIPGAVTMRRRGRQAGHCYEHYASGQHAKVLNPHKVAELRRAYRDGEATIRQLAARYGCTPQAISDALRGRSYVYVPGAVPVNHRSAEPGQ